MQHTPTLKDPDAAAYIGLSTAYLKKGRLRGRGPDFVRVGRSVRYRTIDLDRWLEAHLVKVNGR